MKSKKFRPTSYIVMFWNEDGTAILKVEDISSIEICPINEDKFCLQALMQNGK